MALMALTAVAQANQDPYYARRATLFDELPIGKKATALPTAVSSMN